MDSNSLKASAGSRAQKFLLLYSRGRPPEFELGHPQVIAWHCRASWSENGLPPDEQGRRDGATADGQSTRAVRMLSIWPGRRPVVRA